MVDPSSSFFKSLSVSVSNPLTGCGLTVGQPGETIKDENSGEEDEDDEGSSSIDTGAVVGGVLGGVGGIALAVGLVFYLLRKKAKKQAASAEPPPLTDKPELGNTQITGPLPPLSPHWGGDSTLMMQQCPGPHAPGPNPSNPPTISELHAPSQAPSRELAANAPGYLPASRELHAQPQEPSPLTEGSTHETAHVQSPNLHGGQHSPQVSPAGYYSPHVSSSPAELQGQNWHAGAVPGYHELPSESHAR